MQEVREVLISEIIFHNDTNAYTVAIAETREEQFTVVGALPDFCQGRTYALTGEWKTHPTYGEQFAFTEFREVMPTSKDGIEGFLASGVLKGIGKKTAAAIVSRFGEDALRIIEEEPDRLVEVSGIGPAKAAAVAEAFQAHREFAEVALYFQQYGISAEYAMKLYKQYGSATIAIATENPYSLVKDISGIGFKKADAMALKLGISKNDEYRIKSGVEYTLWYFAGEGHTFMPQKELCAKAAGLLDVMRGNALKRENHYQIINEYRFASMLWLFVWPLQLGYPFQKKFTLTFRPFYYKYFDSWETDDIPIKDFPVHSPAKQKQRRKRAGVLDTPGNAVAVDVENCFERDKK